MRNSDFDKVHWRHWRPVRTCAPCSHSSWALKNTFALQMFAQHLIILKAGSLDLIYQPVQSGLRPYLSASTTSMMEVSYRASSIQCPLLHYPKLGAPLNDPQWAMLCCKIKPSISKRRPNGVRMASKWRPKGIHQMTEAVGYSWFSLWLLQVL